MDFWILKCKSQIYSEINQITENVSNKSLTIFHQQIFSFHIHNSLGHFTFVRHRLNDTFHHILSFYDVLLPPSYFFVWLVHFNKISPTFKHTADLCYLLMKQHIFRIMTILIQDSLWNSWFTYWLAHFPPPSLSMMMLW